MFTGTFVLSSVDAVTGCDHPLFCNLSPLPTPPPQSLCKPTTNTQTVLKTDLMLPKLFVFLFLRYKRGSVYEGRREKGKCVYLCVIIWWHCNQEKWTPPLPLTVDETAAHTHFQESEMSPLISACLYLPQRFSPKVWKEPLVTQQKPLLQRLGLGISEGAFWWRDRGHFYFSPVRRSLEINHQKPLEQEPLSSARFVLSRCWMLAVVQENTSGYFPIITQSIIFVVPYRQDGFSALFWQVHISVLAYEQL